MHTLDAADRHLRTALDRELSAPRAPTGRAAGEASRWWPVFQAQATSRHLDVVARELQAEGRGFYTIGSAGHEANALVAMALRPDDPALLHYRSGAFYLARAAQVPGSTPVRDVLQGLLGSADEPIAGGRHKVFGHPDLAVIPQTSTIASHLPRAVGLALAIPRAHRLGARAPHHPVDASTPPPVGAEVVCEWPADAVVVCSFGDASANHSTAAGAVNTALNAAYRGLPVPILLLCEDNGLGISVPTPPGWVEAAYGSRPGLSYLRADGSDPRRARDIIATAVGLVREQRRPVFLHLLTVRFGGHAGSDAEIAYRSPREIEADYARDPILGTIRALIAEGADASAILARYDAIGAAVRAEAERLRGARGLGSATEVMAPLAPRRPSLVAEAAGRIGVGPAAGRRSDSTRRRARSRSRSTRPCTRSWRGTVASSCSARTSRRRAGCTG